MTDFTNRLTTRSRRSSHSASIDANDRLLRPKHASNNHSESDCSESTKPGTHFNVNTIQAESETHLLDLNVLFLKSVPNELHVWTDGSELPFLTDFSVPNFCDVIFKVDNKLFKCHKVIIERLGSIAYLNFENILVFLLWSKRLFSGLN